MWVKNGWQPLNTKMKKVIGTYNCEKRSCFEL